VKRENTIRSDKYQIELAFQSEQERIIQCCFCPERPFDMGFLGGVIRGFHQSGAFWLQTMAKSLWASAKNY
jgi:hypothetical protein